MEQRILRMERLRPGTPGVSAWTTYRLQTAAKSELERIGVVLALMAVFSDSRLDLEVTTYQDGDFDLRWQEQLIASVGQRADLSAEKLNRALDRFRYLHSQARGVVRDRGDDRCLRVNFGFDIPDRKAYEDYFGMMPSVEDVTYMGTRGLRLRMKRATDDSTVETVRARASFQV